MKVLAPAAGESGLAFLRVLSGAAAEFNRTLDIRLRFLDIGIDLLPVRPLHGQSAMASAAWRARMRQVIAREAPRLVVVLDGDPAALPAREEAEDRGLRVVVFIPPDDRDGPAMPRVDDPTCRHHELGDIEDPAEGRRLIEILVAERAGS